MFKKDELNLEAHLDSLADSTLEFDTTDSKLTKQYVPQLSLKVHQKPIDYWQSFYLREHVSSSFKKLLMRIDSAQRMHFARKELKLDEDPWDNYLFHDGTYLAEIICHNQPLHIREQVVVAKFVEYTMQGETVSQYKV
jgi:hypothetical protein